MSLYLKAFKQNLIQNGTVVSEKNQFEFLYVHDLGPRSRNVLHFMNESQWFVVTGEKIGATENISKHQCAEEQG